MLHRLVGRAVLADADGVVRPHVHRVDVAERGQARGRPHVVGEHQERRAVGAGEPVHRHRVDDVAHRVLTDAEVQRAAAGASGEVVAAALLGDEGVDALHRGVVRAGEVGRAAPQLGHRGRQRVEHLSGRRARGQRAGLEDRERLVEALGGLLGQDAVEQLGAVGVGLAPRLVAGLPLGLGLGGPVGGVLAGVGHDGVVDGERGVLEAQQLLHRADLVATQLGAVDAVVAGLVGQRPADDRGDLDEVRLVLDRARLLDDVVELGDLLLVRGEAVGEVDVVRVPAVRGVARLDVLGERDLGVALDRDPVVVVEQEQVAQVLGGGQRGRLGGDALLHAAVTGDAVDVVVEDRLARDGARVEHLADTAGAHREADRVGDAGAQRAGGALDALGPAELGVAGGLGVPRAQRLQVGHLEAVAGQEQLGVLRDRAVARGQDEAVAAEPAVVGGVALHDLLVEQVGQRGQRDRGARVAVADLLDGIRGEHARGVDRLAVEVGPGEFRHGRSIPPVGDQASKLLRSEPRAPWPGACPMRL